ncbi:uncharacterized protein LOC130624054 [Hydractinia symbiolongicarpus]|uniref:uncharacterized protein LOC130624054 n=1 Tax=Hydractinia symbiolongicarpus TaxID=13093 RepID=UPI002549C6CC|nr:uncharacterized protein LOC130624054 [Hydractinia symbiolongicarpus]
MHLVLAILEICVIAVLSTEIHVSNNGVDNASCGRRANPCKTIHYTAKKRNTRDTIILDGGTTNRMVYFVTETMHLHETLRIKKKIGSYYRPLIMREKTVDFDIFHVQGFNDTYLSLHGIDFNNMQFSEKSSFLNIFAKDRNISIYIDINNCNFQNVSSFLLSRSYTNSTLKITVRNSLFFHIARIFSANLIGKITSEIMFNNVMFNGREIEHRSYHNVTGNVNVIFTNSTFIKTHFVLHFINVTSVTFMQCQLYSHGYIKTYNTDITVRNSIISGNKADCFLYANQGRTFIANCTFNRTKSQNPILSIFDNQMSIINSTFLNSNRTRMDRFRPSSALYAYNTTGKILSSNFINNKAYGGALYMGESRVFINNSNFLNNTSFDGGSAMEISNFSTISINNSNVTNNTAIYGGGIRIDSSRVSLVNMNVSNNTAKFGGCIEIDKSNVSLVNTQITNNTARYGGGIRILNSNVSLVNTNVSNNTATDGGAIRILNSYVSLVKANVDKNTAMDGGGIRVFNSKVSLVNTNVTSNTAINGGGILIDYSKVSLENTNVSKNTAKYGGGILIDNSNVSLVNTNVTNNIATDGGGIQLSNCGMSLVNTNVSNNTAIDGGGIRIDRSKVSSVNTSVTNNTAVYGGGIRIDNRSEVSLVNTNVTNNIATDGGGIQVSNCGMSLVNTNVNNNTAIYGGGIRIDRSKVSLVNTSVTNNIAENGGGGIRVDNSGRSSSSSSKVFLVNKNVTNSTAIYGGGIRIDSSSKVSLINTNVTNNVATEGGGIEVYGSIVSLVNTNVTNNVATDGGGIEVYGSIVSLVNTNVTNNNARYGGGIRIGRSSNLSVVNTTIKFNKAGTGGGINAVNSQLLVYSSVIRENIADAIGGMYCLNCNVTINNVNFDKNVALDTATDLRLLVKIYRSFWLNMNNVAIKAVGKRSYAVPPALDVHLSHMNNVKMYNVNITLSGVKDSIPPIYLTLPKQTNISLDYTCPMYYNASYSSYERVEGSTFQQDVSLYVLSCQLCPRSTYRLQPSTRKFRILPGNIIKHVNKQIQCFPCPPGGNCDGPIKSEDRFWGYVNHNHPKFIPCPEQYCCSQKDIKCTSIESCARHRTGKLCGECKTGYQVNYFDNQCITTNSCASHGAFWMVFLIFGLTYALLLAYLKDISFFSKYFFALALRKVLKVANHSKQKEKSDFNLLNKPGNSSINNNEHTLIDNEGFVVIYGSPPIDEVTSSNHKYYKENSRISGILKVLVAFYQIKSLIHVKADVQTDETSNFLNTLALEIFNLNIPTDFVKFCPKKGMTVVEKIIIKEFLFLCCMLLSAFILFLIAALFRVMRRNRTYYWRYRRFLLRASICCLQVVILGYTIWAKFSLQFINCRNVNGEYILHVNGEITCYTRWQIINIAFFVLWILPFPLSLCVSVRLFENHKITAMQFFYCVFMPPLTIRYWFLGKCCRRQNVKSDTILNKYIRNMFQEPFRQYRNDETCLFWDTWRLYQRLVIAVFATFFIDPMQRLCFILPIMLLLLVVHLRVKPYKSKFINWLETTSLVSLCFLVGANQFRAFLYMYSYKNQENIILISAVLNVMEFFSTPVTGFVLFLVWKMCKNIACKAKRCL